MRWLDYLVRRRQTSLLIAFLLIATLLTGHALSTAAWLKQATAEVGTITYGATVNGQIAAGGAQDWQFVAGVGDVAAIHLLRTGGDLIAGLTIRAANDQPVITVQAAHSGDLNLSDFPIPQPGVYTIHVFSVDQTAGSYTLALLNTGSPAPSPTPNAQGSAGSLVYGQTVHGLLDGQAYNQTWTFTGATNDLIDLQMRILNSGSDLTGFLTVRGPHGDLIANSASTKPASSILTGLLPRDAAIYGLKLPNDGTYTIVVSRATTVGKPPFATGDYLLSVTLHNTVTVTGTPNATLTAVQLNGTVSGQLSAAQPISQYQLPNGTLAMRLSFTTPHRIAHLRVLSSSGAIVFDRSGLSPLELSGTLAGPSPLTVQIFAEVYDDQPTSDFTLNVYPIAAAANALRLSVPVHGSIANAIDNWFFIGQTGALISIRMQTDPTLSAGLQTVVTAPNGSVLLQRRSGAAFDQPLLLPLTGVYQITIEPIAGVSATSSINNAAGGSSSTATLPPVALPYTLTMTAFGINGTAFSRFSDGAIGGLLTVAQPVSGTLGGTSGGASQVAGLPLVQRWTVDARAGQSFDLIATVGHAIQPIGLLWIAPDGTITAGQTGAGTVLIERLSVPQDGRYTVVVFDPVDLVPAANTSLSIPYALRLTEDSSGVLSAGQPVKSLLTTIDSLASWTIDVPVGSLIAAHLSAPDHTDQGQTPLAFAPTLALIDPTGQVVSRVSTPDLGDYRAVIGGDYRIVVGGQFTGEAVPYVLRAEVQSGAFNGSHQANPAPPAIDGAPIAATKPPLIATSASALITPPLPGQIANVVNTLPVLLFDQVLRGEIPAAGQQIWRVATVAGNTLTVQAVPVNNDQAPALALFDTTGHLLAESLASPPGTPTASRVLQLQYASANTLQLYLVAAATPGSRYTLYGEALALNRVPLNVMAGRPIAYGQPIYGELLTAGQVDHYLVYGSGNDLINVSTQRATDDLAPSVTVQTLNGLVFATDKNKTGLPTSTVNSVRLPESALYVITVQQAAAAPKTTGRYWLEVERAGGTPNESLFGGLLSPMGGSEPSDGAVIGALTPSAVGSLWLFMGRAGEQLSLAVTSLANPAPLTFQPLRLQLQDTAGTPLAAQDDPIGVGEARIDHLTLPADGVYRVQISGGAQVQGYYRLTATIDPPAPVNKQLIRYGQTMQGTFDAGHLANQWTFAGTAGDTVAIALRSVYGQAFSPGFQVISASGVPLATAADVDHSGQARVDSLLLPFSGTYTIVAINPDTSLTATEVYSLGLSLLDTKAHSFGGLIHTGETALGELYPDDPVHSWLFIGQGGQTVTASLSATDGFLLPDLTLETVNGTVLAHALAIHGSVLPADGVYLLSVTGADHSTGSYTLALAIDSLSVAPVTITPGSTPQPGLIADDRLTSRFVFTGQQNERVHAQVQRESTASLALILELQDASGQVLARADADRGLTAALDGYALPANGSYQLVVSRFNDALGLSSGRFTIGLTLNPAPPPKGVLSAGKVTLGQLGDSLTADRWTFNGQAGQVVALRTRVVGGDLDTVLTLYAPDNRLIASADDSVGLNAAINGAILPADGTYTVTVSRFGNRTQGSRGTYELRLDTLFMVAATLPAATPISAGQPRIGTLDAAHPNAIWSFSGLAGQIIQVGLTYPIDDVPMTLVLQGSDQTPVAFAIADSARRGTPNDGHSQIAAYTLPVTGTYLLRVDRPATTRAAFTPYTLTLTTASNGSPSATIAPIAAVIDAAPITLDQPIDGTFSSTQHFVRYPLHIPAGKAIRIYLIASSAGWQPSLTIFNADGSVAYDSWLANNTPVGVTAASGLYLAATDRDYILIAQAFGDAPGAYRLSVQSSDTEFSVGWGDYPIGVLFALANNLTLGGAAVRRTVIGSQPIAYRFTGAAKTVISLALDFDADPPHGTDDLRPGLSILNMNGEILASAVLTGRELFIDRLAIPADGQYALILTSIPGASTGVSFTIASQVVGNFPPITLPNPRGLRTGVPQSGSLSAGKPIDVWTFDPSALDSATVTIKRTGGNVRLTAALYNPDGLIDAQFAAVDQDTLVLGVPAPLVPGAHTLIISSGQGTAGTTYGNYRVSVTAGSTPAPTATATAKLSPALMAFLNPPPVSPAYDGNYVPALSLNTPLPATFSPGQLFDDWSVEQAGLNAIAVSVTEATIPLRVYIVEANSDKAISGQTDAAGSFTGQITVENDPNPNYVIQVVAVNPGSTGSYTIRVSPALASNGGGLLLPYPSDAGVPAESGTLTTDHRADSWRVDRTENQSIMVTVARMAGDLPLIVTLYDAAGQIIPLNSVAAVDQSNAIVYSAMAGAAGRYTIVIAAPAGSRTSTDTVYNISLAAP